MLPVLARFVAVLNPPDLVALAVHEKNHADGSKRRRDDEDKNPVAQRLDHLRPGRGGLRVTQRTALGENRHGKDKDKQRQPKNYSSKPHRRSGVLVYHWGITPVLGWL